MIDFSEDQKQKLATAACFVETEAPCEVKG